MKKQNRQSKFYVLVVGLMLAFAAPAVAQDAQTAKEKEAAYVQVTNQRAEKIVKKLDIADDAKALRVRDIIAQQYRDLSELHEARDAKKAEAKEKAGDDKAKAEAKVSAIEKKADAKLDKLHNKYIAKLSAELTTEQVDRVKDGMTYGVVPITYQGYQDMLPDLTEEQKAQILAWLVEAREHAMDAGSSEKKHHWFGKYKGRINNYLSAAGYDLKKAGNEWQARLKAEQAAKKAQ